MLYNHIPDNYKYCMECMAFTPHSENIDVYSEFTCDVCGQDIKNYDNYCGRCGYVFSEDDLNGLDSYEQIVHGGGCHHSLPGGLNPDFQVSYLRDLDQTYAEQVLDEFVAALSSEDRIRLWQQIQYHNVLPAKPKQYLSSVELLQGLDDRRLQQF